MCTLTFVPTKDGYVAGMNRDEKLIRPHALPPERFDFPGATAVFPREHSVGTWIGCNSHGNLLALLNWNDVVPPFGGATLRSRGLLIRELIGGDDLGDTRARYAQLDLSGFLPFRLIGAFLENRSSGSGAGMVCAGKNSNSRGRNGMVLLERFRRAGMAGSAGKRVRTQKETDRWSRFPGSEICINPRPCARSVLHLRSPQRRGNGELHRGAVQRGRPFHELSQRQPLPQRSVRFRDIPGLWRNP